MAIVKKKVFDCARLNLYAVVHFVSTILLALGIGRNGNIPYFTADNTNLIFLIIFAIL